MHKQWISLWIHLFACLYVVVFYEKNNIRGDVCSHVHKTVYNNCEQTCEYFNFSIPLLTFRKHSDPHNNHKATLPDASVLHIETRDALEYERSLCWRLLYGYRCDEVGNKKIHMKLRLEPHGS